MNQLNKPIEEQVFVGDLDWQLHQKKALFKLIAKSLFKQFDRTNTKMLEFFEKKSNFDRAVCEIFTHLSEPEPPLEITLQWFQSHDKQGQGAISLKEFQHTVGQILEIIFQEKQKRRQLDYLQWNFVGKITKPQLKKLAKGIYFTVNRSEPGNMNSGEFDHGICQLAEKLNTRAPDLKLTRLLQTKYIPEGGQITQKKFIHVVKRLCGFNAIKENENQPKGKIIIELDKIETANLTEICLVIENKGLEVKGRVLLSHITHQGKHDINWKFESFTPSVIVKGSIEFQ